MGNLDWQLGVALVVVAAAALFLARRIRRMFKNNRKTGCGTSGCGACPTGVASEQGGKDLPLVTLNQTPDNNP